MKWPWQYRRRIEVIVGKEILLDTVYYQPHGFETVIDGIIANPSTPFEMFLGVYAHWLRITQQCLI